MFLSKFGSRIAGAATTRKGLFAGIAAVGATSAYVATSDTLAAKSSFYSPDFSTFLSGVLGAARQNPDNLMAKKFDFGYFASLSPEDQVRLWKCCITGVDNIDSGMGCYAMQPDDYDRFSDFFDPVIRAYHKAPKDAVHETNWDLNTVDGLPSGNVLDVSKLGLGELSMRVRVGRNLAAFPLPGAMTKQDRINFEKAMLKAFSALIKTPGFGGRVYSLTPDFGKGEANPNLIPEDTYNKLVKDHIMFKDMAADPYLSSAGISSDWPYGRGCYVSEDRQVIIWFGEEDHLRVMSMKKGTVINQVFDRLKTALDTFESIDGIKFAHSPKYGYVTSCPTNLGTGMRASVHLKCPNLTRDGTDAKCKAVCRPLGLSVRGVGGEHTPIGADGTVDISPSARMFITEAQAVAALYKGIQLLIAEEKKA